jgi:hypothetical protein
VFLIAVVIAVAGVYIAGGRNCAERECINERSNSGRD